MKQCVIKVFISALALTIFFSGSIEVFAASKPIIKPVSAKSKVVTKKATIIKKAIKNKKTKKKKEKLVLNPPLIDPLNPPGGR